MAGVVYVGCVMPKPLLCVCLTCRKPQISRNFRRHSDELRSRHDSCIACEDIAKAEKIKNMTESAAKKRTREKAYRDSKRVRKLVVYTDVKTRWIGGKYPGVTA